MIAIDWLRVPVLALDQPVATPNRPWVCSLKPVVSDWRCGAGSPFFEVYKGGVADCPATLEKLYVKCASDVPQVIIPDLMVSLAQAVEYGSFLGGRVPAHYLGGEGLEVFFLPQQQANKPSESGG